MILCLLDRPLSRAMTICGRRMNMNSHGASLETLKAVFDAFNRHDLDRIMSFFSADCVLEMPRGRDPWGSRYVGLDAVRDGLRTRFAGIPDVRYEDDSHFVSGDIGVSQWTLRGTSTKGERIEVRGCDFYTFRDGKIVKKDSFWKIRES
jgi:ketosteroid isomerase-like protein